MDALKGSDARLRLRISCLPSIAVGWLILRLARFRERYPDITLPLSFAGVMQGELLADVDVMIIWQDNRPPAGMGTHRLFSGAIYPVETPLYLEAEPASKFAAHGVAA